MLSRLTSISLPARKTDLAWQTVSSFAPRLSWPPLSTGLAIYSWGAVKSAQAKFTFLVKANREAGLDLNVGDRNRRTELLAKLHRYFVPRQLVELIKLFEELPIRAIAIEIFREGALAVTKF